MRELGKQHGVDQQGKTSSFPSTSRGEAGKIGPISIATGENGSRVTDQGSSPRRAIDITPGNGSAPAGLSFERDIVPANPAHHSGDLPQDIRGISKLIGAVPRHVKQVVEGVNLITRETDHLIDTATAPVRRKIHTVTMPRWEQHFDGQFDRPSRERLAGERVNVRLVFPKEVTVPQIVVFAHGFQQISRDARGIQQDLYKRGIASASFEPGPFSIDKYAAVTAELMEHAAERSDHNQVTLLKISMGGVYGSGAALLNQERVGSMLYVEPGGWDKQKPVTLALNTLKGGIQEFGVVMGERHYKDAGVLLEGLASATHKIIRHPIPALKQINAIAAQHFSAAEAAIYMKVVHGTPTAIVLMAKDGTFEQINMLGEVARANKAIRSDNRTPHNKAIDIVKVIPDASHFTLGWKEDAIVPIAETVPELYVLQQQNGNGKR